MKGFAAKRTTCSFTGRRPTETSGSGYAASRRGLHQHRACVVMWVSSSMVKYRPRQSAKDTQVQNIISNVVAKHSAYGRRLVFGWMREQGMRGVRINPITM